MLPTKQAPAAGAAPAPLPEDEPRVRTEQQPCLVKIKAKATRFTNAQTYHGSRVQQRIHKINLDNTSYLSILLPHGHVESVDDVHLLANRR